jgi:hypothetical protein
VPGQKVAWAIIDALCGVGAPTMTIYPFPPESPGCYAGIGSRSTPDDLLRLVTLAARRLTSLGWTLRSGHAPGADQAFERGAAIDAEVFLPWPRYEHVVPCSAAYIQPAAAAAAYELAGELHPAWPRLSRGVRALHARNCHQILGPDLRSPVAFVLCWTPGGERVGGTATALRLADRHGVPVLNLAGDVTRRAVEAFVLG